MSRWKIKQSGALLSQLIGYNENEDGSKEPVLRGFVGTKGEVFEGDLNPNFVERYNQGEEHARSLVERLDDSDSGSSEDDGQYDPSDHSVDDVVSYLRGADDDEVVRVLAAEEEGKGRSTILKYGEDD